MRVPVASPDLSGLEREYLLEAFDSGWISSQGAFVTRFEETFADFVGVTHAVSVFNGTVALHLGLAAAGIGPGDEVIVPALTYIASANSVVYTGATPVFVDVDERTWNPRAEDIERLITPRTKGVMVAHLYGTPARMNEIGELCRSRGILLIEDAAEALGASFAGRAAGAWGDFGTFSFFGNKTLTTGEGGMVVTSNAELADTMRRLRNQGQAPGRRYWHDRVGYNYRMTNLQAAIGLAQIERGPELVSRKQSIARWYQETLPTPEYTLQGSDEQAVSSHWMTSVLIGPDVALDRDELMARADERGVELRPLFYPLPAMPPYAASPAECPVADSLSRRGISLPSGPNISDPELAYVSEQMSMLVKDVG